MNNSFSYLLYFYLIIKVLSVIPEWNLSNVGIDLLESANEVTHDIYSREIDNLKMVFKKNFTKTNEGIKVTNILKIGEYERVVQFDHIESYYKIFNDDKYVVCPKGTYHPYNIKSDSNEELIPKDFSGKNWDLRCINHPSGFFLAFYLINGNDKNIHLTNNKNVDWYGGASIELGIKKIKETYDFLLKDEMHSEFRNNYQMLATLNEDNQLKLEYFAFTLKEGTQTPVSYGSLPITEKKQYTQAYFRKTSESNYTLYYFTYNNISDFKTGYSNTSINEDEDYYYIINKEEYRLKFKNNTAPHLEFFDDMIIEKMDFLLYNKFLYYQMKSKNNSDIYHGIFDIELNKIIFNTKEEIIEFQPYSNNSMLAITKDKAYRICVYANNSNCTDTCPDQYILDIDGNICGDKCSDDKYLFVPSGVCINECDETYYTKIESSRTCGLCRDIDNNNPYKVISGTKCLNKLPNNSYVYNEKLMLLNCSEGYHVENDSCVENCYPLCLNCSEYSEKSYDQKCDSCIDGFELDDNHNCRCPQGSQIKGRKCEECGTENNCKTFIINSCDCETCNESYYLNGSKCEPCDSNCKSCSINATNCIGCENNYFLEKNHCYKCTECKETDSQTCKCQSCKDGFYLDFYQCKECENNCKTCENANECSSCDQFYKLENSNCKKCPSDIKCKTTIENECNCASCNSSYFLHNGECINCVDKTQCKTYKEDNCECNECKEGFYLEDYQCKQCKSDCKTCENGNECSSCDQFYKLENSRCEKCPSNIKCETTKENECNCKSCNESYFLHDDECINCIDQTQCKTYKDNKICECEECKEGFYKEDYLCKQCNDICLTCDGGFDGNLDYHCLSCKKGSEYPYLLIDDKKHICVKNCSDYNAITNTEKNICEIPKDETDGGGQGGNGDGEADYMLWIFVSIIGILLILVSICICKRFICRKSSDDIELINEMEGELTEK